MTREIALHCMKSYSELHSDLCEECPIYGQTGSDHCFEDALQYVIGMLEQEPYFWEKCPYYEPDMIFDGKDEYDMGQCKYKQEPCEDCISREYILSKAHCCCDDLADDKPCCVDVDDIKNAPSVKPRRTKGEWLAQQETNGDDYFKAWDIAGVLTYAARYKCNKCGFIQTCIEDHGQYSFCPNCGADMRGETNG